MQQHNYFKHILFSYVTPNHLKLSTNLHIFNNNQTSSIIRRMNQGRATINININRHHALFAKNSRCLGVVVQTILKAWIETYTHAFADFWPRLAIWPTLASWRVAIFDSRLAIIFFVSILSEKHRFCMYQYCRIWNCFLFWYLLII